jgi:hypothetical protein
MILVVDIAIIEAQECSILGFIDGIHQILNSHLDSFYYFILHLSLIILRFNSELIYWFAHNT